MKLKGVCYFEDNHLESIYSKGLASKGSKLVIAASCQEQVKAPTIHTKMINVFPMEFPINAIINQHTQQNTSQYNT